MFENRGVKHLTPLELLALNTLISVQLYLTRGTVEKREFLDLMTELRETIFRLEEKELGPRNRGSKAKG